MDNSFKNISLIDIIIRWKIAFLIVLIVSVTLAIIFSSPSFIKPRYRSTTILYPSNLIPYSSETPTEQMLQIFKSDDLREKIIKKFNLTSHYRVDSTKKYYKSTLKKKFENNISIKKNEYDAVVINVLDENPIIACNIAEELVNLFNLKARELQRAKTAEVVIIYKNQLIQKQHQIDSIENELAELRQNYGLLDYKIQVKEISKSFVKNNSKQFNDIWQNLKEKGGNLLLLSELLQSTTKDLSKIQSEYDKALSDLNKELTYTNIISKPTPADKKAYPIRWLILLTSTISALILTFLVIAIIEQIKFNNSKLTVSQQ